jgi:hypothetical protein
VIPLLGFTPDSEPTAPGIITDCTNLIPSEKGMVGGPTPGVSVVGLAALPASARGASVNTSTSGTRRTFAGTQTKLYELTGSTWTDVSRVGDYTGSTENRWCFAQFGDAAIATNDTEKIQASVSGDFADISNAPQARIVVAAKDFLLAFDTFDATYGDRPDGWWCSAFQNHSDWAPALSTQATNGRLVGVPGGITAAAMLGNLAIAYKAKGVYVGQYVGSPIVWQWDQVPGEFGCVGPEAVVDIGGAHFIVGDDNFWLYDGTRPVPIGAGQVRQWFYNDGSATYRYRTIVHYDRQNNRVWVFYPSTASSDGTPDRAIVYHVLTKQWGRANRSIECVLTVRVPGVTWDTLSSIAATWDSLPSEPWDSQSWQAGGSSMAFFNTSHLLQTLTGTSDESSFTTGDYGNDWRSSSLNEVRLRFVLSPTTATATGYSRAVVGDSLTTHETATLADGKFDLRQDNRWHRMSFDFTGDVEMNGIDVPLQPSGYR